MALAAPIAVAGKDNRPSGRGHRQSNGAHHEVHDEVALRAREVDGFGLARPGAAAARFKTAPAARRQYGAHQIAAAIEVVHANYDFAESRLAQVIREHFNVTAADVTVLRCRRL